MRALALSGPLLFSGANDKSIKVWNLDSFSNSHTLESHSSWIRALATDKDVLASQLGGKRPPPCLTTPPHRPPWTIWRLTPLLRNPERS